MLNANCCALLLCIAQIPHLPAQTPVSANQAANVETVDQPGGDVCGVQEFD
jgi:hypothetical protein